MSASEIASPALSNTVRGCLLSVKERRGEKKRRGEERGVERGEERRGRSHDTLFLRRERLQRKKGREEEQRKGGRCLCHSPQLKKILCLLLVQKK